MPLRQKCIAASEILYSSPLNLHLSLEYCFVLELVEAFSILIDVWISRWYAKQVADVDQVIVNVGCQVDYDVIKLSRYL